MCVCIAGGIFVGTDLMYLYVAGIISFCYIFYFNFIIFVTSFSNAVD